MAFSGIIVQIVRAATTGHETSDPNVTAPDREIPPVDSVLDS